MSDQPTESTCRCGHPASQHYNEPHPYDAGCRLCVACNGFVGADHEPERYDQPPPDGLVLNVTTTTRTGDTHTEADPQWVDVVARALCYGAPGEQWHPDDDPEDWIQEAHMIVKALLVHIAAPPEQETRADD